MKNQELITYLELDDKIELLGLSHKNVVALKNANINTIADLLKKEEDYGIHKIRNIGSKSLKEIEDALIKKCNIRLKKDISELEKLGLSTRALNMLVNKYGICTLKELLSISLDKRSYYHLDANIKSEKEIIDKVHSLGLKFECEIEKEVTLDTKIGELKYSKNLSSLLTCRTIGDVLKLDLDPESPNSIYNIRGLGPKNVQMVAQLLHSYGFMFESEKDIKLNKIEKQIEEIPIRKQLTVDDSIFELKYYPILTRRIADYNIRTIGDLLSLSTDKNINHNERGIYNIKGLGEYRVKELMNYLHSLGFIFADERTSLDNNITLDYLFNSMNLEYISREFYEKINTPEEIEDNNFIIYFKKMADSICKNEFGASYTNKEIIAFLINKLVEHKKKLLNISNDISKNLELKKQLKKQ